MFWNGSTAMDGLSGNGSGTCGAVAGATVTSDVAGSLPIRRLPLHAKCLNGAFDVLQGKAAKIVKGRLHPARHGFMDRTRDHNAASRSFRLKAGGDVDAISIKIVTIDDQVAQVQAHAEHKRSICRLVAVGLGHGLLELDSGAQRIDCAGELDQSPVAGQLDQTPSVFRQNRIEVFRTVLAQARQRPALVTPHQAGVADNVCSNDCRQFALLTRQRHSPG